MIRNDSAKPSPSYSIARPAVDYDSVNPESGQEQVLLSQFDRVDKISENNTFRFVHASDPEKNFECQLVLDEQGVDLDYGNLLVFAAVFGFGGSFISLGLSKWMAKRTTGAQVIESPSNDVEAWLVQTVGHQAQAAGIGMPEVAVFDSPQPNAFATGARRDSALVAVSTGLLRSMERDEVAAREAGKLRNQAGLERTQSVAARAQEGLAGLKNGPLARANKQAAHKHLNLWTLE